MLECLSTVEQCSSTGLSSSMGYMFYGVALLVLLLLGFSQTQSAVHLSQGVALLMLLLLPLQLLALSQHRALSTCPKPLPASCFLNAAAAAACPFSTQIQAMAAMQDELGPKSVTVLVTWVDGQVHFEVRCQTHSQRLRVVCHSRSAHQVVSCKLPLHISGRHAVQPPQPAVTEAA